MTAIPMADALAEILALARPDRLLGDPRANGSGVRVAVIDSGVDAAAMRGRHPDLPAIQGGLFAPDQAEPLPYRGEQSAIHGTTVADVIARIAPACEIYSADVFGASGSCEVETLIRALRHATDVWQCKIVNMSLGIPESRLQLAPRRTALLRAIEEAYFRDVLVIAAAHNDHPLTRSFPAVWAPPLIAVDKALYQDPLQFDYLLREQVEFQAHGRGYYGPFASEPATSWAAPHLTGIAARLVSLKPDLKLFELKTLLYWMARNHRGE